MKQYSIPQETKECQADGAESWGYVKDQTQKRTLSEMIRIQARGEVQDGTPGVLGEYIY